ncbi:hypothetical protein EDC01DRAFT_628086 [Geopyxis carbonaria]|nr:hypothetical protein EDC01DRAFT_628086 [Geopyxis carbonaria]
MQFKILTLTLALSFFAFGRAADTPDDANSTSIEPPSQAELDLGPILTFDDHAGERDTIICDTTSASPTRSELEGLVALIRTKGPWMRCMNTNKHGSRCTQQFSYKGAAVSMCGPTFRMVCQEVANDLLRIRDRCQWYDRNGGWKAGGRVQYNADGKRTELH